MLPIRGLQSLLFRLVAVPVGAALASHFVLYRRLPWQPGYQFPLGSFLIIAGITVCCWEINLWVFRRLDRTMPFHPNPGRRIRRQLLEGGLFTTLMFAVIFTTITRLGFGCWPSPTGFATGLFICFSIATIINGIYVGLYLLRIIYGQQPATVDQLNAWLTKPGLTMLPDVEPRQPGPLPRQAKHGILIESGKQMLYLQPTEIAYFYSSGGLVQLIRADGRRLTTNYDALTKLTDRLSPAQFFQINRQFVIHLNAVRFVRDDVNRKLNLTITPGLSADQPTEQVIISRYRSAEFKKWLVGATTGS